MESGRRFVAGRRGDAENLLVMIPGHEVPHWMMLEYMIELSGAPLPGLQDRYEDPDRSHLQVQAAVRLGIRKEIWGWSPKEAL